MTEKERFEALLLKAQSDERVLGFILQGSRGKGFETAASDYDALLVVSDEHLAEMETEYNESKGMDVGVKPLGFFDRIPAWNSPDAWDRYDYTHVKILIDRNGDIAELVKKTGAMTKKESEEMIRATLDGYINGLYRTVKCHRDKNESGMRLESAASIPFLLDVLFALEQRPKPFLKYLEKELKIYPLQKLPWSPEQFIEDLLDILATGNIELQQKMHQTVKNLLVKEGYGDIYDGWEGKDEWAMAYPWK